MSLLALAFTAEEIHVFQPQIGYLGVRMHDISQKQIEDLQLPAERGVYVQEVERGSPAEAAGLKDGDVILEFAGIPVRSARQFQRLVSETPAGRTVMLEIWRDGQTLGLEAEIARRKGPFSLEGLGPPGVSMYKYRVPDIEFGDMPFHFPGPDFSMRLEGTRLGVQVVTLTEQMAEFLGIPDTQGVLVLEVHPNTAAERAGIQAGDVIVSVDDQSVKSPTELREYLSAEDHELELIRKGSTRAVTVELKRRTSKDSIRM
jgi:serine protease Do